LITIMHDPIEDPRMRSELLYGDPLVVAAGVQSPWARRRKVLLAELVNECWLFPQSNAIASRINEAFRASGLDVPRATLVTVTPDVRINLLTTGRFLSLFMASSLRFFAQRSQVRPLPVKLPVAPVPIGMTTLKMRALSPVAQAFAQAAREVAKPLANRR
jgi:DNA-binding transcriptional LysR family regulator